MSLTVGQITYANCVPFFHYLAESGFSGEIVRGVPAELNRLLAAGQLDICPSSSIEYARHASDYLLLPGHSISSIGPVQSVLFFTDLPMHALNGMPITITGESATSVALLEVLLREFFQVTDTQFVKGDIATAELHGQPLPMLLIGDRALKGHRVLAERSMVIDLGELWYHYTGLPFVFALWIINRKASAARADELRRFGVQLGASRERASRSYAEMAAVVEERVWMGEKALIEYWQQVSYDLDPQHLEGLRCFYSLLEKNGLIDKAPELEFFG